MNLDHLKYCTNPEHKAGYSCSRCHMAYCMDCDPGRAFDPQGLIMSIGGRYCPDWRCQREAKIEDGRLGVVELPERNPRAPLMYATLRRSSQVAGAERPIEVGDLVLVEVPPNCTIHALDAARMAELMALAKTIGDHWRGDALLVSPSALDRLAELTENLTVIDRIDADGVDVRLL